MLFSKDSIKAVGDNRFWSSFFNKFRFMRTETDWLICYIWFDSDADSIFGMLFINFFIFFHLIIDNNVMRINCKRCNY